MGDFESGFSCVLFCPSIESGPVCPCHPGLPKLGHGPTHRPARTHVFKQPDLAAFLGLDVRVRDSGQWRGRRQLTKKGDPEVRRLLYLAAMQASRSPRWKAFYHRYLDRGLSKIQALVILARKLARVAFALLKHHTDYHPNSTNEACGQT